MKKAAAAKREEVRQMVTTWSGKRARRGYTVVWVTKSGLAGDGGVPGVEAGAISVGVQLCLGRMGCTIQYYTPNHSTEESMY